MTSSWFADIVQALRVDLLRLAESTDSPRATAQILRRLVKYGLAALFALLGLTGWLLRRSLRSSGGALIVAYHGVCRDPPRLLLRGHALAHLTDQLRFLKRHLRPVRLAEIVAPLSRDEEPPAGAFAVTFDDGLVSNVTLAIPVLESLDLAATFFVPSGLVETSGDLWASSLQEIVFTWRTEAIPAEPGRWPALPMGDERSRFRAYRALSAVLKSQGSRRSELLDRLAERRGGNRRPPLEDRVVGPDRLLRMNEGRMAVGSHSRTHPILSHLDEGAAREEIGASRRELESMVGAPVLDFAYPNGSFTDFSDTTRRFVEEAGYRCALTTEPGFVRRGDDRFALRRCVPEDVPAFVAAFDLLIKAWRDGHRPGDSGLQLHRRISRLPEDPSGGWA